MTNIVGQLFKSLDPWPGFQITSFKIQVSPVDGRKTLILDLRPVEGSMPICSRCRHEAPLVHSYVSRRIKECSLLGYFVDRALSPDNAVRHLVSYVDFNGDRAFDVFYAGGSIGNELDPSTQTTKPITAIGSFGKSGIKLLLGYSDGTLECYDTSTILYSLVWSDRISDQGAVASISVGERITIVSYTYGKIRIYDTNTMNEIENDGDYVKRITAVSQGDTNDHIVYVINGTGGSGETSNSLCVFEYQD
jgi:WD40 repeat protein